MGYPFHAKVGSVDEPDTKQLVHVRNLRKVKGSEESLLKFKLQDEVERIVVLPMALP